MLNRTFLTTSAIAGLFACAACDQNTPPAPQNLSAVQAEQPSAATQAAAEAGNEVEQAVAPNAEITTTELQNGVNAADLADPSATLSTASVKTPQGETVGEVRSVVVGTDGKADAVIVEVGGFLNVGERPVSIDAEKFTFLRDRNILVAELTKADVEKLPTVPPPAQ